MGRRKQEGASLKTVYDFEEGRRVCFIRNGDGTFGFLEWTFSGADDSWIPTRVGAGSRFQTLEDAVRDANGRVPWLPGQRKLDMLYQLGWRTLPGLRGLSVSEFRATPTDAPDNEKGVAIGFADEAERDAFLRLIEVEFAARRFNNAADAFDSVKAYVLDHVSRGT